MTIAEIMNGSSKVVYLEGAYLVVIHSWTFELYELRSDGEYEWVCQEDSRGDHDHRTFDSVVAEASCWLEDLLDKEESLQ
jgi:hypothetical protein